MPSLSIHKLHPLHFSSTMVSQKYLPLPYFRDVIRECPLYLDRPSYQGLHQAENFEPFRSNPVPVEPACQRGSRQKSCRDISPAPSTRGRCLHVICRKNWVRTQQRNEPGAKNSEIYKAGAPLGFNLGLIS